MATTSLKYWGNSVAIRIPKSVLEATNMQVGDEIDFVIKKNKIELVLSHEVTLDSLLSQIEEDAKREEFDWGKRRGKEQW